MGYLGNNLLQPWFIGDFITGRSYFHEILIQVA